MKTQSSPTFAAIVVAFTILAIIAFTCIGITTSVLVNIDLDKVLKADAGWWPMVIVATLLLVLVFHTKLAKLFNYIKNGTSSPSSARRYAHKSARKS